MCLQCLYTIWPGGFAMHLLQLVFVTTFIPSSAATKVAVMPVEATNLAPDEAEAIGVLIAQAYGREGGVEVVSPRQALGALGSSADLPAAAHTLGVQQYILVNAVRLGSRVTLHASLNDANGHGMVVVDMIAESPDDLPFVATSLARALLMRGGPVELPGRYWSSEEPWRRMHPDRRRVASFKLGVEQAVAHGARFNLATSLAFDLRYEFERSFMELATGFGLANGGSYTDLSSWFVDIGGNYFLTTGNNALYLGAGISPRVLWYDRHDSTAEIAPFLQVGFMMFRSSRTRLYFDLRATQNLVPIKYGFDYVDCGWYVCESTKNVYPTELAFFLGFGW
jgi:hypothetical protein